MATQPTHRRAILNDGNVIDLGDLGTHVVRFDDASLIKLELELDEILDRLNVRLERRGEEPYESVWDALEELSTRYPVVTISTLLYAAVPSVEGRVPIEVLNDPAVADPLIEALSVAFGTDPSELDQEEDEAEDPPAAGGDAGASTGEPSSPSGPAPSRPEA